MYCEVKCTGKGWSLKRPNVLVLWVKFVRVEGKGKRHLGFIDLE